MQPVPMPTHPQQPPTTQPVPMPQQPQGPTAQPATQMPAANEYKAQQSNILATLIPQIMNAMGGGDANVQRILQEQQNQYQKNIKKQNLMGFMRTVTMKDTGQITPELIMKQAQTWGVEPGEAMAAVNAFVQFRKQRQGERQSYFRQMPGGGVQSIEAYPNDPVLSGLDGWMRGKYAPGPQQKPMSVRDQAFARLSRDEQRQALLGKGRTQVNVNNVPAPPKGYWYNKDQSGLEVIPGGPVDTEQKEAARKEIKGRVMKQIQSDLVNQNIDRALPMVDTFSTGIPGLVTGAVPGTNAHDLQNTLDTIEANLSFDKLQAMRDASPTGGALGQVSERELSQLEKAWGSLKRSQSKEQLKTNLMEVQKTYNRIVHGQEATDTMDVTMDMRKKSTKELLEMLGQ